METGAPSKNVMSPGVSGGGDGGREQFDRRITKLQILARVLYRRTNLAVRSKAKYCITYNLVRILIQYGFSVQFLNFHSYFTHQCRQQLTALKNSKTSIYVDFHHDVGWDMCINWILKSRNPRNSNFVRKNRENNYFSSRTKFEVIRYTIK